jgi:hypothetical protein
MGRHPLRTPRYGNFALSPEPPLPGGVFQNRRMIRFVRCKEVTAKDSIPRREVVRSPVDTVRFSEFRRCNSYIATIITGQRPMAVQGFPEPLVDERKQALVRTEVRCKPVFSHG